MATENKSSKALMDFKTKYPNVTSADLQSFVLGYQANSEDMSILEKDNSKLRAILKDIIDNDNPNNYISPCMPRDRNRLHRFIDKIKTAKEYLSHEK